MNFQTLYPNSYIDDIHPVDVQSYTSNGIRATPTINSALADALDTLDRTRSILEVSDNHRKALGKANKELLDQVQAVRVELHTEKQKLVDLQNSLTLANNLKRQAETQLEHWMSKCVRIGKELDEEKAINANLGAETNALYERYESMQEMAVVSTARNKELEAQLARLYGTPKERVERAEREQEEITYKKMLEKEFEHAVAYQKLLEDDNERLRTVVHSLEAQLGLGVGTVFVKQEDEKPKLQSKELFIKDEEYD